ncbi:NAD(P)-dependent oxidoreductase [Neoroseomonas lacus]|uniref:D-3-phosphoglycerate dehydrogenase n=1 Tax=Neoroseomonas lacus TaxID=287609 RepID=A0A917KVS3_9PROT|nr:NAD(P)-dependent oxidoreductase [Neoroseomonas lacus]GGJ32409.1 D-3-phosphoglycerate dehydrogenase [Neoroseomonas lacus]
MSASAARFRIGYLIKVPHQSFLDTAAKDPALEVVRMTLDDGVEAALKVLETCQGYYVRASRDELPKPMHVHDELLARLPNLLMAASQGAGYDTIEPAACTRAGVLLVNQAGGNAEAVAEHAVGMMLSLLKRFGECHAAMREGRAQRREEFMGRNLYGKTVGIVGIGNVGTRTAAILNAAFHCRVLAYDPYVDAATVADRGAEKIDDLATMLGQCDIVSLHCPLTPESRAMMAANAFAAMKPGSVLVTTARGSIHDEMALVAALKSGHIAAAGLDVWEQEPPPGDHPLLSMPNVICTQHTAGVTHESRSMITRIAAEAFSDFAAGRFPPRIINPEVKARVAERYLAALGRPIA